MYANSSKRYWKKRKKDSYATNQIFVIGFILLFFTSFVYFKLGKRKASPTSHLIPRPNATEIHVKKCTIYFKSRQNECLMMCNSERESVPRPAMYQACMQGCTSSFFLAIDVGCSADASTEGINIISNSAYEDCSKFQNMLPKPELYTKCKQYHEIAADRGFRMGSRFLSNLLNTEWRIQKMAAGQIINEV